mgnify:CR=1 FL=1
MKQAIEQVKSKQKALTDARKDLLENIKGKSKEEEEDANPEIETIEQVEKSHIEKILKKCGGNRTHAAKKLGLNVRTLRNKIKDFEIEN